LWGQLWFPPHSIRIYPQLFVGVFKLYLSYLYLFTYSDVKHDVILRVTWWVFYKIFVGFVFLIFLVFCVFFFSVCLWPVSLNARVLNAVCFFWIVHSWLHCEFLYFLYLNIKVHENELTFKMASNVKLLYLRVTYFVKHWTKGNNITQKLNTWVYRSKLSLAHV
jgi:hypothetical protein